MMARNQETWKGIGERWEVKERKDRSIRLDRAHMMPVSDGRLGCMLLWSSSTKPQRGKGIHLVLQSFYLIRVCPCKGGGR